MIKKILVIFLSILLILACSNNDKVDDEKIKVTTTINYYKDLVENIGKDKVTVNSLMGISEDPHLYSAKPKDYYKLKNADIIIYNGLHLEGKLTNLFENIESTVNKNVYKLSDSLSESDILGNDPHIWFSIDNYIKMSKYVYEILSAYDKDNDKYYYDNYKEYVNKLENLKEYVINKINEIPKEKRVLITAHDAFNYYANEFGLTVKSIQGISTDSEASIKDINELAKYISNNKIKTIYLESSISDKTMLSLKQAVKAYDYNVNIGDTLYSDSMGQNINTYIKVVIHNTDSIVKGLK